MLEHIELKEDYSDKIHLLHHIAVDGVIIWPKTRAGQVADKKKAYDEEIVALAKKKWKEGTHA